MKKAEHFHIELQDISITDLAFGKEFMLAVEHKQVAQQEAERQKFVVLKAEQERLASIIKAEGESEAAKLIAEALKSNSSITYLDVSNNKFGNVGLIAIAEALKVNKTLVELSVIGQSQPFGEAALQKMTEMFEYNVVLQKINWRLHSRQSFALNKLISRNVDINRRIVAGQKLEDYINLVPGPRKGDFGVPKDFIAGEGVTIPTTASLPQTQIAQTPITHSVPQTKSEHIEETQTKSEHIEETHTESQNNDSIPTTTSKPEDTSDQVENVSHTEVTQNDDE